jgi:DNA polymerase III subunit delta
VTSWWYLPKKAVFNINRADFIKQVNEGRFLPVYLFLGEEKLFHEELLKTVLNKIIGTENQEFNFQRLSAAGVEPLDLISNLETPSFFGDHRVLYLEDFESAVAGLDEAVLKSLARLAGGVHLIVSATKLDGRKKLHQEMQARIVVVDCGKLAPNDLPVWIRQRSEKLGLKLTPGQIKTIAQRLGPDLLWIRTELEKISTFAGKAASISDQELDDLIPSEPEPDIFGLIDAVALRDPRAGLPRLQDLLDSGENETKILATLARQFRNIAAAHEARGEGLNAKLLAGTLGINPYVAEKSFTQASRFSLPELQKILERLLRADWRIKTGQREPRLELELAVVEICCG